MNRPPDHSQAPIVSNPNLGIDERQLKGYVVYRLGVADRIAAHVESYLASLDEKQRQENK